MAIRTDAQWLAVNLYYGEPWEGFLIKAVKPYIDVVLTTGVANRFYFERSWEKGPHIRLWFKGNAFILAKMLRPNLDEHFLQYFESRPSYVKKPLYTDNFPDDLKWRPNNSIHYPSANPGDTLFGGQAEANLFEKQYQASSLLVLDSIKEKASAWTYNEMISTAIKIHLGFVYAIGFSLEEAASYFDYITEKWFANSYPNSPSGRDKVLQSFTTISNLQRKDTVPYHSALWQIFKNYEGINDPLFVDWINTNADISLQLNLALAHNKLRPKRKSQQQGNTEVPPAWDYYETLIKLTNNRLGIFNKNEGFLFFTMAQSLQSILHSDAWHTNSRMRV
ncbi:MAG TPA: hypothetical protein ENJ20_01130 [Bacteroidetes bacterium]|nr:hypothetical protein [Bacteroidota bacterium]